MSVIDNMESLLQKIETKVKATATEAEKLTETLRNVPDSTDTDREPGELKDDDVQQPEYSRIKPEVSFTCHFTRSFKSLSINRTVRFNQVDTNVGGAYERRTGKFTAPRKGLYSFFVTTTDLKQYPAPLRLFKNGVKMPYHIEVEKSGCTREYDTVVIAMVEKLRRGDEVWVQNECRFPTFVRNDPSADFSTFSGYLIQR